MNKLEKIYSERFDQKIRAKKKRVWKTLVDHFFSQWIPKEGVLVDLGCGQGEFSASAQAKCVIGIDFNPNPDAEDKSSANWISSDVTSLPLASESCDCIFTSNLAEHLKSHQDVETMLSEAHRILKPKGTLMMLGPNIRFLHGAYYDFWDHYTPISDKSIVEALKMTGFKVSLVIPRFLPYTTQAKLPTHHLLAQLYIKLSFLWSFLGKQFFIVATKNNNI